MYFLQLNQKDKIDQIFNNIQTGEDDSKSFLISSISFIIMINNSFL